MCNTREENAAELAQESTMRTIPIARAALLEKLIDYRSDDWDENDTEEALRYGRLGYEELTNEELEQLAVDFMMEEDGEEVRYTITDADTPKPSAEEINQDMLAALKAVISGNVDCGTYWKIDKDDIELVRAAIAKAEGK